jgi:hypothetical protein
MRSAPLLALAVCGCRGLLGIQTPIDASGDTAIAVDAPAPCTLWHPQGVDPCALGAPLPPLVLGPGRYIHDTTNGKLSEIEPSNALRAILSSDLTVMQSDGSTIAVLSVESLTLATGAALRVVGDKPLLVVAWSTIRIDGAIDAGSHVGDPQLGAGANKACQSAAALQGGNAPALGGSGGGGGAGHRGVGGSGGAAGVTAGGAGGGIVSALVLRGGCPGAESGTAGLVAEPPSTPNTASAGGGGGGAIRLLAQDSIDIAGSVSAGGAGGAGALDMSACGGGGGGSGGYIALDAPAVNISGAVAANGGGGGGGGGGAPPGDAGSPGGDGRADLLPASGGGPSLLGCGRPGGDGAADAALDGKPGVAFVLTPTCRRVSGGGGGGGSSGFIFVASPAFTPAATAKISPPAVMQ